MEPANDDNIEDWDFEQYVGEIIAQLRIHDVKTRSEFDRHTRGDINAGYLRQVDAAWARWSHYLKTGEQP
jgi:hypothetical protein